MGRTTRHFNNALGEKGDAPKKLRALLKEKNEKYNTGTSFSSPIGSGEIAHLFTQDSSRKIVENFNMGIGNDPLLDDKINEIFQQAQLDSRKFFASAGNSPDQHIGTSFSKPAIVYPTAWPESAARGATDSKQLPQSGEDLVSGGLDEGYGNGWMELNRNLYGQVLKDIPTSFDASITPTYFLTPKYYNGINTSKRKIFINDGSTVIIPTINEQDEAVFTLNFTTINGFVNGNNMISYEFENSDGSITSINKSFILSNVSDLVSPTIVTINNVK